MLFKSTQREVFDLSNNPTFKTFHPQFKEEGLNCVTTRLLQQDDTDSFKRPIVILSKHPVVHSLTLEHHKYSSHAGV